MADGGSGLFRQKTLDRMSSPDQLTDYLKVTRPGVWAVLAAIVLLLVGTLAWACVGTLETTVGARAIVKDGVARVALPDQYPLVVGMELTIESQECVIESVAEDDFGRTVGTADVKLPDGSYEGTVVVDEVRAIDLLLQSR